MEGNGVRLTPTQLKIMDVLKDGQPHYRAELLDLIDTFQPDGDKGDAARRSALSFHVSILRGKLRPIGKDLAVDLSGGITYRIVQHISEPMQIVSDTIIS